MEQAALTPFSLEEELGQLKNLAALLPARPRRRPPAVDGQRVAAAAVSTRLQLSIGLI